ncbi:hypothetical protein BGW80DRAFT_466030 [Lactifluus volemus]|nr:hypothetical protein BGW80DRAFT_466030 [Lactifluus volemus]
MDASKPTSSQPQESIQMNASAAAPVNSKQHAHRLRGGGAGRDCFLGLVEIFICFECCKVRLTFFTLRAGYLIIDGNAHFSYRLAASVPRISSAAPVRCVAKRAARDIDSGTIVDYLKLFYVRTCMRVEGQICRLYNVALVIRNTCPNAKRNELSLIYLHTEPSSNAVLVHPSD